MAMLTREIINKYHYIFNELRDPRVDDYFLMSSPFPVAALIACYVYFVKVLGPKLMKDRPAFQLDRVIQVYNVVQIVLSLYLVERSLTLGWMGTFNWFCEPVDYSTSHNAIQVTKAVHVYFVLKLIDLLDTVFFVLRKKTRQVTFLHVYHHACMAMGIWVGVKFVAGGHSTFLGFLNSIVHSVMYSYYLVTSIYPQHKNNLWWKKHITQMQMLQFLMIILHSGQVLFQSNCGYPWGFSMFLVPQNAFMLVLFYDFYRKAYFPKKAPKAA